MRIPRIFTEQDLDIGVLALEPEASRHVARALRMREGQSLILFNGRGGESLATISGLDKKSVHVTVDTHRAINVESPLRVHLGIAISRGERFDWVVQKATELGVHTLTPLVTERTGVSLAADRAEKKQRHWQKIAISACEQCGRDRVPEISSPSSLANWMASTQANLKLMLHTAAENGLPAGKAPASVALLIGPEGGFSPDEASAAEDAGFSGFLLGPRILRTETAPVAALAVVQARWGDLGGC